MTANISSENWSLKMHVSGTNILSRLAKTTSTAIFLQQTIIILIIYFLHFLEIYGYYCIHHVYTCLLCKYNRYSHLFLQYASGINISQHVYT
jgi:hypothetical protein